MATNNFYKVTRLSDTSSDEENVVFTGSQGGNQPALPVRRINEENVVFTGGRGGNQPAIPVISISDENVVSFSIDRGQEVKQPAIPARIPIMKITRKKDGSAYINKSQTQRASQTSSSTSSQNHTRKRRRAAIYSSSDDEEAQENTDADAERRRQRRMRQCGQKTIPTSIFNTAPALAPAGDHSMPDEVPGPSGLSGLLSSMTQSSASELDDDDMVETEDEYEDEKASDDEYEMTDEFYDPALVNFVCQKTIKVSRNKLSCAKISPCGQWFAVCGDFQTIKLYSMLYDTEFKNPITLTGHKEGLSEIAWSADSNRLISASDDKTLRLWDIRTKKSVSILKGHTDLVMCTDFNAEGVQALSGSFDGSFRFWDTRNVARPIYNKNLGDIVNSVQFNPTGDSNFVVSVRDSKIQQWNARTKQVLHELEPLSDVSTTSARYTSDGQSIIGSFNDSKLMLWKPQVNTKTVFVGHTCQIYSTVPGMVKRNLICGSDDGTIRVWNMDNQEIVQTLKTGHNEPVIWTDAHPTEQIIATSDFAGCVQLWVNKRKTGA